ncbi:hypothetical protein, partial [Mycobacterium szulgai]|uniref:hypothetical protein n=1 Tax=Mycobacterium szulgai TaxID=1787 RepID=UPI0021F2A782
MSAGLAVRTGRGTAGGVSEGSGLAARTAGTTLAAATGGTTRTSAARVTEQPGGAASATTAAVSAGT